MPPGPVVEEVVSLILQHQEDGRLRWHKDGRVRVFIGKVMPDGSAVAQTLAGRRKRLRAALRERLAVEGWKEVGLHVYGRSDDGQHRTGESNTVFRRDKGMRKSTIQVTDLARLACPSLPTGDALQFFKNWILDKVRQDDQHLLDEVGELPFDPQVINFAPDHYAPLGIRVLVFRNQGISVTICSLGEIAAKAWRL